MTASTMLDGVISEFTLAVLEGTGWYQVNYNMSEPFSWGKGKGCSFVNCSCVKENSAVPRFPEFCSPLARQGCTYTGRAIGYCGNTAEDLTTNDSLLPRWNYWGNDTVVKDIFADNCPYYNAIAGSSTDCEDPTNKAFALLSEEIYGPTSRCFTGTLSLSSSPNYDSYCFKTQVDFF